MKNLMISALAALLALGSFAVTPAMARHGADDPAGHDRNDDHGRHSRHDSNDDRGRGDDHGRHGRNHR